MLGKQVKTMARTQNLNIPSPPIQTGNSNDERAQSLVGVRSATINDSMAGGGGGFRPRKPFTGFPIIPKAPVPAPPKPTPTPDPVPPPPVVTTPPAPPEETPKGLPAKDPQPAMPLIPAPKRTDIGVNAKRYNVKSDRWEINAIAEGVGPKPNINPLRFGFGSRPELKPLLRTDGVIVKVGEHYLVSPQTLADIRDAGNPHYDVVENGRVGNTAMGKTVPVIEVNISGLEATGIRRDIVNTFAAVKSVDYVYETPTVMGVPEGILEQINYTLDTDTQRPEDGFEIWELNLTGDYSIEKLKTDTAQEDGKLDKAKLEAFTKGVGDRLKILQKDFNIIKSIFYRGELAEGDRKASVKVRRRATIEADTEEEIQKPERSAYVIKQTEVVAHQATPNTAPETPPATQAAEGDLPEISISPIDAPLREIPKEINTVGLEKAKLLNDWNSYGFTPEEKAELKTTTTGRKPMVKVADGTMVGIGAVRWSPRILDKARVIVPYTQGPDSTSDRRGLSAQREWRDKWQAYYGFGTNATLITLNQKRIAELVQLTNKVVELERAEAKNY